MARHVVNSLELTILYDNYPHGRGFTYGWGFSCLLKTPDVTILFDTGEDGGKLLASMAAAKIRPEEISGIVLSHEHWDHVGGLDAVLEHKRDLKVYLPRSFSGRFKEHVRRQGAEVVEAGDSITGIAPGIYSTGEMGSGIAEQGLFVPTAKGLVFISGCAHPGIVPMLKRMKENIDKPIALVLGGFHLGDEDDARLYEIARQCRSLGVHYAAPTHCSGDRARNVFGEVFGDRRLQVGSGWRADITELIQ